MKTIQNLLPHHFPGPFALAKQEAAPAVQGHDVDFRRALPPSPHAGGFEGQPVFPMRRRP